MSTNGHDVDGGNGPNPTGLPPGPSRPLRQDDIAAQAAADRQARTRDILDPAATNPEALPLGSADPPPPDLDDKLRERSRSLSRYRQECIAAMAAEGHLSVAQIAKLTKTSYQNVYALIHYNTSPDFTAKLDRYRDVKLKSAAVHQLELMDMLPETYTKWRDHIRSEDAKVSLRAVEGLWDRCFPAPTRVEHQHEHSLSQGTQIRVQQQLNVMSDTVPRLLQQLEAATSKDYEPERHLRDPDDVIPAAAQVPER